MIPKIAIVRILTINFRLIIPLSFHFNFAVIYSGNNVIKNAWKINNADKDDKVYVLYAKSAHVKQQWMDAFAEERKLVADDREKGKIVICCSVVIGS